MSQRREKKEKGPASKELKIETKPALTLNDVKKDNDKIMLLHTIKSYGEISERALQHLVKELVDKGLPFKYKFVIIGGVPISKKLKDDIVALLYVGLLEVNPKNKKLRITGDGLEFIEKEGLIPTEDLEKLSVALNEVRPKIMVIDAEHELATLLFRRGRRRRRYY